MKYSTILLFVLLVKTQSWGQIWYFGGKAGIQFNGTNLPVTLTSANNSNVINSLEGTAMTNDNAGNLLFYTDGQNAYFKDGSLIPYASGVPNSLGGNSGSTQCAVIVPIPERAFNNCGKKYYIFTVKEATQSIAGFDVNQLEFTNANPKGIITRKSTLLTTTRLSEKITAVNDGAGGYWFLLHGFDPGITANSKTFYKLHITPGSTFPATADILSQEIGSSHSGTAMNAAGQLKFSLDGKKVAAALYIQNKIDILDFSPSSGLLSNPITISSINGNSSAAIYGLEFSPNKNYLYATSIAGSQPSDRGLYQIELSTNSIRTVESGVSNGFEFGLLQLGPDKRIYCANMNSDNGYLGVINSPDLAACNYVKKGIPLGSGTNSTLGLPTVIQNEASCGIVITGGGGYTLCGCPNVTNLIENGDFENGNTGFTSKFGFTNPSTKSFFPGMYTVTNQAGASALCQNWISAGCGRDGDENNKFLVVNGSTGQSGEKTVWSQAVQMETGKDYKLCMTLRNLPQCCFSVKPKIIISYYDGNKQQSMPPVTVEASNCPGQNFTTPINIPANAVASITSNIAINLDQSGMGDGNDLAIDNISLIQLKPMDKTITCWTSSEFPPDNAGIYKITANMTALPSNSGFYWEVALIERNGVPVTPAIVVSNPNAWWPNPLFCDFKGYDGNTGQMTGSNAAGTFNINNRYRITRATWSDCNSWTICSKTTTTDAAARRVKLVEDNKYILKQNKKDQ